MIMLVNVGSVRTLLQTTGVVHIKSVVSFESMGAIVVPGTRAPRWATLFVCSLCFAMPCAAGPFAADGNDPPENVVIVTTGTVPASDADVPLEWLSNLAASDADVPTASLTTTLPSAPLLSDASRWSEFDTREARASGVSLLRADWLAGMLESLLDQGFLVPETGRTYRALPEMAGTPPMVAAGPLPQSLARDGSQESTWRETGFNVMRWTSAALAVLAVVGTVIVLVTPALRRRLFFPDMPQMPPRPA